MTPSPERRTTERLPVDEITERLCDRLCRNGYAPEHGTKAWAEAIEEAIASERQEVERLQKERSEYQGRIIQWIRSQVSGMEKCDGVEEHIGWMTVEIQRLQALLKEAEVALEKIANNHDECDAGEACEAHNVANQTLRKIRGTG